MLNPSSSPAIPDLETGILESNTDSADELEPLLSSIALHIHSQGRSRSNHENDPEMERLTEQF